MERLIVENFGAIKKADIVINKYNILIGHTSSGKSIVAKLISIFNNNIFWAIREGDTKSFIKLLVKYNINFDFEKNTKISYIKGDYIWNITREAFTTNYPDADLMNLANTENPADFINKFIEKNRRMENVDLKSLMDLLEKIIQNDNDRNSISFLKSTLMQLIYDEYIPVYIPAERTLISTFTNSVFSLLQAGTNIPQCIKDFGSLYEKARNANRHLDIDFMNIQISFSEKDDTVLLKNDNKQIKLTQSSSGIQSIIPLLSVFNQYSSNRNRQILVIEEPELNLYPTTQMYLIDWIMTKMRKSSGKIVITTHSPYVLSTIDNLILGHDIIKNSRNKKIATSKVKELIPSMGLVDYDKTSSYYFSSNGIVKNIKDNELRTIGAENIDDASEYLGNIFNELCNLEQNEL